MASRIVVPAVTTILLLLLTFPPPSYSETEAVRRALVQFMENLSRGKTIPLPNWGWNETSDPCSWAGVTCDPESRIRAIVLESLDLGGFLETRNLRAAQSLNVLGLSYNNLIGPLQPEIADSTNLTHLFLGGNQLQGSVPGSISHLTKLKRFVISDNRMSGELPRDLSNLAGRLTQFNVSDNRLVGRIPSGFAGFPASSFVGNPGLCGRPLSVDCSPAPAPAAASPAPSPI